jgi:hypothetical protein
MATEFTYLKDKMREKNLSLSAAAACVNRDSSTIRNWLNGSYLSSALTVSKSNKSARRNVAYLISRITGDPEEIVREEIKKYLVETGQLSLNENSYRFLLNKFKEEIEVCQFYDDSHTVLSPEKKELITSIIEVLEKI